MGQRMKNAPVYYALGLVAFRRVTATGNDYIKVVRDVLGRQEYTAQKKIETQTVALKSEETGPVIEVKETPVWLMDKEDKSSGFIIGENFLTYQTARYDTFETFLPELLRGINILHGEAGIQDVSRMGLRYLDAVIPREGEAVTDYLQPGLRGLPSCGQAVSMMQVQSISETVFSRPLSSLGREGIMAVRTYQADGALGFPADIRVRNLRLAISHASGPHAVIDTDHYFDVGSNPPLPFSAETIQRCMKDLHQGVTEIFQCSVTDHARTVWNGGS